MKKFWNDLVKSYHDKGYAAARQARYLRDLLFIMILASAAFIPLTLLGSPDYITTGILVVSIGVFIGALVILSRGTYQKTELLTSIYLMVMAVGVSLSYDLITPQSLFGAAFLNILALSASLLFLVRKNLIWINAGIGLAGMMALYFLKVAPTIDSQKINLLDTLILPSLLYVFAILLFLLTQRSHKEIQSQVEEAAAALKLKADNLEHVAQKAKEGLHAGGKLIQQTMKARQTSSSIKNLLFGINSAIDQLDQSAAASQADTVHIAEVSQEVKKCNSVQNQSIADVSILIATLSESQQGFQSAVTAKQGVIETLVTQSDAGKQVLENLNRALDQVNRLSASTQQVMTVIDEISARTSLLAMNAAIEAAHAGSEGRGFAVVAAEVRKLASETETQSKVIHENLQAINQSIGQSVSLGKSVHTMFLDVHELVKEVSLVIGEINARSRTLAEGFGQMNQSVESMIGASGRVEKAVTEVSRRSEGSLVSVEAVKKLSEEVHSKTTEILESFGAIEGAINSVHSTARDNMKAASLLNSSLTNQHLAVSDQSEDQDDVEEL